MVAVTCERFDLTWKVSVFGKSGHLGETVALHLEVQGYTH